MRSNRRELKKSAWAANLEIARRGLAIYTFGNASAFDRKAGLVAIKPSGVAYEELERGVAEHKGTEAALVLGSGYAANVGVIPALAGRGDAIFSDELNHASIVDGCRLSRAELGRRS